MELEEKSVVEKLDRIAILEDTVEFEVELKLISDLGKSVALIREVAKADVDVVVVESGFKVETESVVVESEVETDAEGTVEKVAVGLWVVVLGVVFPSMVIEFTIVD